MLASQALSCVESYEITDNLNARLQEREPDYAAETPPPGLIKAFLSWFILLCLLMAHPVQTPPGRSNTVHCSVHMELKGFPTSSSSMSDGDWL